MLERTFSKSSTGNYKEKSSSFHAIGESSSSIDQIKASLLKLKDEFSDASHICYAYRIKQDKSLDEFASDAGEPKGSAGLPILNVLKRMKLVDSAIFVMRYFGGTKLGVPGLIHAYGAAAEDVVKHAKLKPWVQLCTLLIMYQYEVQKQVESVLKQHDAIIIQQNFTEAIETTIEISASIREDFIVQLEQITNGTIHLNKV